MPKVRILERPVKVILGLFPCAAPTQLQPPPRTSDRLLSDLTPADRNALHQDMMSRTSRPLIRAEELQLP